MGMTGDAGATRGSGLLPLPSPPVTELTVESLALAGIAETRATPGSTGALLPRRAAVSLLPAAEVLPVAASGSTLVTASETMVVALTRGAVDAGFAAAVAVAVERRWCSSRGDSVGCAGSYRVGEGSRVQDVHLGVDGPRCSPPTVRCKSELAVAATGMAATMCDTSGTASVVVLAARSGAAYVRCKGRSVERWMSIKAFPPRLCKNARSLALAWT